jgi:hypothetical protein
VAHKPASKKLETSPACVFCGGCDDETATHFSLECPAFNSQRQPLLDDLSALVGSEKNSACVDSTIQWGGAAQRPAGWGTRGGEIELQLGMSGPTPTSSN